MKVLTRSIVIPSVAALGLSLAACKKDATTELQVDEASEAADATAAAIQKPATMAAPEGPSRAVMAGQTEDKARK